MLADEQGIKGKPKGGKAQTFGQNDVPFCKMVMAGYGLTTAIYGRQVWEMGRTGNRTAENDAAKIYGYARVSDKSQHEDRQVIALTEFGVAAGDIFVEKQSGKDFNRPIYKRLIRRLREGDTLVLKAIDRLGRDYHEILEQWRHITKEIKAYIVVLDMPLLDTRRKDVDLTGTFIADLVLQVLSFVSENERKTTKARQAEGIAAAKRKGVRFGRPLRERPAEFAVYLDKWRRHEITANRAALKLGIPRSTFLEWAGKAKNDED